MDLATAEGGTLGISLRSQITAWQETRAYDIFGTWRFSNPGSMTRTIGLSSRPFERGRLVNSSDTARAAKLSPCNSPQWRSRMFKLGYSGN